SLGDDRLVEQYEAISIAFSAALEQVHRAVRDAASDEPVRPEVLRVGERLIQKSDLIAAIADIGPAERRISSLVMHLLSAEKQQAEKLADTKARAINNAY